MSKTEGTLPCPQCGGPTYSDSEEPGMVFCERSGGSVLACEETPVWQLDGEAEGDTQQPKTEEKAAATKE